MQLDKYGNFGEWLVKVAKAKDIPGCIPMHYAASHGNRHFWSS